MNEKGVSLIELLVAVAMVAVVVSMMALFIPNASRAAISGHYQITAKNLAAGKIQELKQDPYAIIPLTLPSNPFNPAPAPPPNGIGSATLATGHVFSATAGGNALIGGCNCNSEDADKLPTDLSLSVTTGTIMENGITFTRQVCVNLVRPPVAGAWPSNCPDGTTVTDLGMKNIRVRVAWTAPGGTPQAVEIESMVSR